MTLFLQHGLLTGLWSIITGLLLVEMLLRSIKAASKAAARPHDTQMRTVEEVMNKAVAAVRPEMLVSEFLEIIFARRAHATFPVVQEGRLHGILRAADARELPKELHDKTPVRELML